MIHLSLVYKHPLAHAFACVHFTTRRYESAPATQQNTSAWQWCNVESDLINTGPKSNGDSSIIDLDSGMQATAAAWLMQAGEPDHV